MDDDRLRLRLGRLVADRRTDLGMTQLELANLVGVSRPQITNIESGKFWPSGVTLLRLVLGLDFDLRDVRAA